MADTDEPKKRDWPKPVETFKNWYAVSSEAVMALVETERKRMSVPWRIWEIATARMNNWGHASFRPDELVTLVCGSCTKSDRQAVKRGLDVLADMGRIMRRSRGAGIGSTELCVVVNTTVAHRLAGRAKDYLCWEPSHCECRKVPFEMPLGQPDDASQAA